MQICLYDDDVGFYMQPGRGAGRRGRDFLTSPQIGPLFAEVLGRFIDLTWEQLDRPDPFLVVDAGAGPGTLTDQLIAADLECAAATQFVMVDVAPTRPDVRPDLPAGHFDGVVVANELLDNLPFRILESGDGSWHEVRVGEHGWVRAESVDVAWPDAPVGVRLPLQAAAHRWINDARGRTRRGGVVAVDYAASMTEMAERPWLRTYREHTRGSDPLELPGGQDITADVCVDTLPQGTDILAQADFLHRLGIDELAEAAALVWRERAHLGDLQALRARSRVHEAETLTDPSGLGAFAVMIWRV